MHEGIVRSPNFHPEYDLHAGGDVVSVVRHHSTENVKELEKASHGSRTRAASLASFCSILSAFRRTVDPLFMMDVNEPQNISHP